MVSVRAVQLRSRSRRLSTRPDDSRKHRRPRGSTLQPGPSCDVGRHEPTEDNRTSRGRRGDLLCSAFILHPSSLSQAADVLRAEGARLQGPGHPRDGEVEPRPHHRPRRRPPDRHAHRHRRDQPARGRPPRPPQAARVQRPVPDRGRAGHPAAARPRSVSFVYRLRPRSRDVDRVPTLSFAYYNPAGRRGKRFPTDEGRRVRHQGDRPPHRRPRRPAGRPARRPGLLFESTPARRCSTASRSPRGWTGRCSSRSGRSSPAGGTSSGGGSTRTRPGSPASAGARRHAGPWTRSAGRAGRPTRPAAIAAAVLGYFRARYPLPPGAETPAELGDGPPRRRGCPSPKRSWRSGSSAGATRPGSPRPLTPRCHSRPRPRRWSPGWRSGNDPGRAPAGRPVTRRRRPNGRSPTPTGPSPRGPNCGPTRPRPESGSPRPPPGMMNCGGAAPQPGAGPQPRPGPPARRGPARGDRRRCTTGSRSPGTTGRCRRASKKPGRRWLPARRRAGGCSAGRGRRRTDRHPDVAGRGVPRGRAARGCSCASGRRGSP